MPRVPSNKRWICPCLHSDSDCDERVALKLWVGNEKAAELETPHNNKPPRPNPAARPWPTMRRS